MPNPDELERDTAEAAPRGADFAPRRVRADRQQLAEVKRTDAEIIGMPPLSEQIKENAFRFSVGVQNLQAERDKAIHDLHAQTARAEQLEARLAETQTRLEASETRNRLEMECRVRLGAIIENMGGLVADGLKLNQQASSA